MVHGGRVGGNKGLSLHRVFPPDDVPLKTMDQKMRVYSDRMQRGNQA
jgi:hypothetical protein